MKFIALYIASISTVLFFSPLSYSDTYHYYKPGSYANPAYPIAQYTGSAAHPLVNQNMYYARATRQAPFWAYQESSQALPHDMVIGGYLNNRPQFVCRANYLGAIQPGKLVDGICRVGYGGKELSFSRYEVLVSPYELNWLPANSGYIPPNAITGGYENGLPLYVCQGNYHGEHPGRLVGQFCHIAWAGREITLSNYQILIA